MTLVWISTAVGNQSSDMDQKHGKLSKNVKENDKFELIRENERTHILYILDIWSEYIYIYRERAKSKDRAKSSCSWKSIARINREDISKRKHFKGKKGITDI